MTILPEFDFSIPLIVFLFFVFFIIVQLTYLFFIYMRFAVYNKKMEQVNNDFTPPVSIIIAARNESDNLFQNLPTILSQDYPDFEVIVVNHQSIDESYNVLNALKLSYNNLKIIEVERSKHLGNGKKLPLTLGIKSATSDYMIFTDADCLPASKLWLRNIVSGFGRGGQIVIGHGPFRKEKGFLNSIIRLDAVFIAVNYFSFALANIPYMGVGRNLAYTKKAFNSVSGFKTHYSISSGDDDLFVQEASIQNNVVVHIDKESYCYSSTKPTWKEYLQQKSRHYSTSSKYTFIKKSLLGIYPLSLFMMAVCFVSLLFDLEYMLMSCILIVALTIIKWIVLGICFTKLDGKRFVLFLPLLELFYYLMITCMYYLSEKPKLSKWR